MSDKLVMGYWNCRYCGTRKIKGTYRECANCGHPRDAEVEFYMDKTIEYLTPEEAEIKGKGADWVCAFCESLNSVLDKDCKSCGASREDSTKNYFDMHTKKITDTPPHTESQKTESLQDKSKPKETNVSKENIEPVNMLSQQKNRFCKNLRAVTAVLLILLCISCVIGFLAPKTKTIQVNDISWEYTIDIESYETVREDDWQVPDGGRVQYTQSEIHHYDHIIDHYETKTRTYTESVYDGDNISYDYVNNGDGTFTQKEIRTPRYRNETKTETYQEPVYMEIPVYQTKYYYDIEKWKYKRSVTTEGHDKEPYWGDLALAENERESTHHEEYKITGTIKDKTKTYTVNYDIWKQLEKGKTYKIRVSMGQMSV